MQLELYRSRSLLYAWAGKIADHSDRLCGISHGLGHNSEGYFTYCSDCERISEICALHNIDKFAIDVEACNPITLHACLHYFYETRDESPVEEAIVRIIEAVSL